MENTQENENNLCDIEDDPIIDVDDVTKQPTASHLIEVDLRALHTADDKMPMKGDVDVQLQSSYVCTLPGFIRIIQVFMSVGALICVTSTSFNGQSYLMRPGAWRFRIFIFASVVSILISLLLLFTHASTISRMMPIDWLTLDICICGIMTILFLVATATVSSAYRDYSSNNPNWSDRSVLRAGMILGFICFVLYGCHVMALLIRWRKRGQFRHRSLQLSDRRTGSDRRTDVVS